MNTNPTHQPVEALSGAAPWVGGKRTLAKVIVPRLEAVPHVCYAEPFVGMGGVFFRRRFRPESEVINDRGREVATFFRVLQRHPEALLRELEFRLTCRAEYERLNATDPETLTDIERAARLFYLQYCGYGGKPGAVFAGSALHRARFSMTRLEGMLRRLHRRLAAVYIDCLGFGDFITRWDRPTTLFYLDPPYWGCERYYGKGLFERADFERLADILTGLKGRFILSLNDTPDVRRLFSAFAIEEVPTIYRIGNTAQHVHELLISG